MGITRVQAAQGASNGTSIAVSLAQAPANGDLIIACIGFYGNYSSGTMSVASISQTGVTWTQIPHMANNSADGVQYFDMWQGVVGSGASANATVNLNGSCAYGAVCTMFSTL